MSLGLVVVGKFLDVHQRVSNEIINNNILGSPSPLTRFPGAYTNEDPGILISQELYDAGAWQVVPGIDPQEYQAPGPAVWNGD